MLRKLLLIFTLMFAVPALANATWYISTSTSGPGTITNGGQGLKAYADTVASVDLVVAPGTGQKISSVRINGIAVPAAADPTVANTVTITKKSATQYVAAYFTATKYTVTPSLTGSGAITPAFTGTATNALEYGKDYTFKISPNAGYKLSALKVDGGDVALASTYTFTAISANHTLAATFVVDPIGKASVTASGAMTAGQTVTLAGQATANEPIISYSFTVNGAPVAARNTDPKVADFVPAANGIYTAEITATTASTSYKSTVNFKVDGSVAVYNGCVACHGGRDAAIVNGFTNSKHWKNTFEYGSEFTGGEVAGQINPNESWTTKENGTLVTCSAKCHFKSQTNAAACTTCHATGQFSGTTLVNAAATGMAVGATTAANTCFVCHSGSKHGATTTNFLASSHNTGAHAKLYYQMDQKACVACHDAHSTEASYEGCNSCHKPGSPYSIYSSNMVGKAPHFGAPDTEFGAIASFITTDGATCADCHGHNNVINAGWAEGGHGDTLAVPWKSDAGHTWNAQGSDGVNFQQSPQKTNCIRCHSARGFKQFVESGFTNINQVRLADNSVSKASSPLTCDACHLNPDNRAAEGYAGKGLRLASYTTVSHGTKGYVALWGYSTATIAKKKIVTSIQLGDNRNSNLCMPCHSQRASGQEIKDLFAAPAFKQYSVGSAMYPHAAQPAAIFYGKGGYEFTSADGYQDRARHQRIGNYVAGGSTGYNNTGITQGSCVACHMSSDATHSLEITAASFTNTCYKCHPAEFTQADVDAKKAEFDAAVKALGAMLVKKGITKDGINPLPERTAKDMSLGTKDNVVAEKNIGAWFNWYLFSIADKGAYAHNPSYARRLIFDSIDYLDDGIMNSSSANTILALSSVAQGNVITAADAAAAASFTNDPGCMGCHFGTANVANGEAIPGVEQAPHYNTTAAKVPGQTFTQAQFVVPGTQCNYCHGIGHGTDSPSYSFSTAAFPNAAVAGAKPSLATEYAESAHGDINGLAWTDYDFKTRTDCVACHTTNGFVTAVNSNFTNTAAWGTTADTTKQVLGCNACHSSTTWKTSIRTVNVGSLGVISAISYDNVGESNVCIPCHATRENTTTYNAVADASYSNLSFKNPHYLGAAAVFYGKGGFQFYTSGVRYNTYGAAGKVGRTANWSHGRLGMDNYSTTTNATVKASGAVIGSGNKGQCAACHLGPTNTHTFGALEVANATQGTSTYTRGCYGCHNGTDMSMTEFIEEEKVIWDRMMDFFDYNLKQVNIRYTEAYPYFQYNATQNGVTAGAQLKNWVYPATGPNGGTGKQTMGAALNYKLLAAEPGKHVHNRSFGRALIADSIVYLQNGTVGDRSVVAADANGIINFSNYSAANPVGNGVSITTLKSYLTKAASLPAGGNGFARR